MPKGNMYETRMRKNLILAVIHKLKSVKLTDLYKIFDIDTVTLKNDIKFLKDNGLIDTNGTRRLYEYSLTKKGKDHLFSKEVEVILENYMEVVQNE